MKISTSTGKLEFYGDTTPLTSFDEFLNILKVVEAASILQRHADASDLKIIVKILAVMQKLYTIKKPDERAKAEAMAKGVIFPISTKLPVYTAISRYNRQDLGLAFSHVFSDHLPGDLLEVTDLTEQGAVVIATGLLEQFNPTAIPNDLEAKQRGLLGEFVRFEGKPMAFFSAVETKRAFQYQQLLGKSYYDSKRYQRLQELLAAQAGHDEKISVATPALPASNPPEELLTLNQEPDGQEEAVHELHIQEIEIDSDDDDFLEDTSFLHPESGHGTSDDVEVMDIDVSDEPASDDLEWMKDVVVKGK
jgi:hypothetical protein